MTKLQEAALALLNHAKAEAGDAATVAMELSVLGGSPGVICRIEHRTKDCVVAILVPLTDYYQSKTRNKHIMELLPVEAIITEYDRLIGDAGAIGALA